MGPMGAQPGGGSPQVFQLPYQQQAADMMIDVFKPIYGAAVDPSQTPGGWAYPQSQALYPAGYNSAAQYLTGDFLGGQPTLFDQSSGDAFGAASNAYQNYLPLYGGIYGAIPGLMQGAGSALSYLPQAAGNAFNPMYGTMVNAAADNPLYPQAMTGAAQGAAYGATGADTMMDQAAQIYAQGFDPQSALYDRSTRRLLDRSNAINSMSGIAGSPYGAGVTGQTLSDFDINWDAQQLARMGQAAQATSPLFSGATNLAYGSAQLPNQVYMKQIGDVLSALNAQNAAGGTGANAITSLLQGGGQGLGMANNLSTEISRALASIGGQPYSTGATIGNNAISSMGNLNSLLQSAVGFGNNQFQIPQMAFQDLNSYLTGGREAATASANIGQQGFNQTAQGIGGLLGGANALFGQSGMFPLFGAASIFSDRRLKRDVLRVGVLANGLPVYLFRYLGRGLVHLGLMADEVERVHPDAVEVGPLGFKMVNYALAVR